MRLVPATVENGKVVKLGAEPGYPVNQGWICEEIGEDPLLFGVFESNANVFTPDSEAFCDPATGAATFEPLRCGIYPLKKYS